MTYRHEANFIDYGCGFPVTIEQVCIAIDETGEYPLYDRNELQRKVAWKLITKRTRLTGNEIRFLRLYFRVSKSALGAFCDVTHSAVINWESHGDDWTAMKWSTESRIRQWAAAQLNAPADTMARLFESLWEPLPTPQGNETPCVSLASMLAQPGFLNESAHTVTVRVQDAASGNVRISSTNADLPIAA